MKKLILAAALLPALVLPMAGRSDGGLVAFVNVNVIPMDRERVLENHTVVVRDGRIVEMGPAADVGVPEPATQVEGRGRYLIPALAEMHAHLPSVVQGEPVPEEAIERVLFLYAANGIGTIRNMLGHPRHLPLRERVARGELISPTIYTSGPSLNGNSAPTKEIAVRMVTEQQAAGFDLLKIHPGLRRDVFDALAARAGAVKIPIAGHVPLAVGLDRALEARYSTIDHLDGYMEALVPEDAPVSPEESQFFGINLVQYADESRIPQLVAKTREAGTWMVPTEVLLVNIIGETPAAEMAKWPEMRYAAPGAVEQWTGAKEKLTGGMTIESRRRYIELRRTLIKALHDGGVGFLLGSDAPQMWNVPGFSMHRELEVLVAAGLTPYQALETGTRNIAMHYGTLDTTGTVAPGRRADLVLLEANPLQAIGNTTTIAGVMLGGRWLPKAELEQRLAQLTD
jgi:imidazolonepropionase-like amidohydrolase